MHTCSNYAYVADYICSKNKMLPSHTYISFTATIDATFHVIISVHILQLHHYGVEAYLLLIHVLT